MNSDTRLRPIDATRGVAMMFVCLSHFGEAYLRPNEAWLSLWWVYHVTMIASPTFMIVSGMMLGLLYRTHRERFRDIQVKLIDKGLFLLTIGRLLILVAHVPLAGGLHAALRWGFITDAIGVNIIVGSLLIPRVGPAGRIGLGAGAFALSWATIFFWHPQNLGWSMLRAALAGELSPSDPMVYADVFPLLPWFGLFLCSTCLGERLADEAATHGRQAAKLFLRLGVVCGALAVALRLGWALSKMWGLVADTSFGWQHLFLPAQKLPPSPVYLLSYGGAGMILTGSLFFAESWRPIDWFLQLTSQMGQTSLFVFIFQYFVYFSFLVMAAPAYSPLWPAYFVGSLLVVVFVDQLWYRKGLNRLLTVVPLLSPEWLLPPTKGGPSPILDSSGSRESRAAA